MQFIVFDLWSLGMNLGSKLVLGVLTSSVLVGCQSMSSISESQTSYDSGVRQINQVVWDKTGDLFTDFDNANLPEGMTRMVFLRKHATEKSDDNASINVGVDSRFQVSLQSGQFSEVITCRGPHQLSVISTNSHSNNLNKNAQTFHTANQSTQYYYVDIDYQGMERIREVTSESAKTLLNNAPRQSHQISRVNDFCSVPKTAPVLTVPQQTVAAATKQISQTQATQQANQNVGQDKIIVGKVIDLDILFDFDSDYVNPVYHGKLAAVSKFMQDHRSYHATIEGHTDSMGDANYNLQLSQKRADAVKDTMVNQYGAEAARIMTQGFGETRPIATNATAEGRKKNRRVVAIITNKNDATK